MKKGALIIAAICIGFVVNTADAARRRAIAACSSEVSVSSGYIYKNSAPLRSGGVGTPLIGFRNEPTLIGNKSLNRGGTTIYDTNGNKIARCPWASAHGHSGGRFRCTIGTATVRRAAVRKTGSPTILFTNLRKQCIKVADAGRCYGSVKGRCNQLIR